MAFCASAVKVDGDCAAALSKYFPSLLVDGAGYDDVVVCVGEMALTDLVFTQAASVSQPVTAAGVGSGGDDPAASAGAGEWGSMDASDDSVPVPGGAADDLFDASVLQPCMFGEGSLRGSLRESSRPRRCLRCKEEDGANAAGCNGFLPMGRSRGQSKRAKRDSAVPSGNIII